MSYKIVIPQSIEWKIDHIYSYILNHANSRETASKFIKDLMNAIMKLDELPQRNPIYFKSKMCIIEEVRHMIFNDYDIFYRIDEKNKTVQVLEIKHHS